MQTVCCVEPSDDRYFVGCRDFGISPNRYLTIADMLARETPDAVMISSPNEFHLEHLRELKDSGLPLLLEKPLDTSFEKICEVVRFARAYPAPILVGHCLRFAPILSAAKQMLARGDIGRICSVRFVQNCHYGNGGYHNWRRNKEKSGTWFIEKATHDYDIMNWLVESTPSLISAVSRLQAFGGDKSPALHCRDCDERRSCPESSSNIAYRIGVKVVEELSRLDDLCAFSAEVDTPDNEVALIQYQNGVFGTYHQWFFSPRSYHHRIYEVHGTLGALEIDLGDEHGGQILVSNRYAEAGTQSVSKFDYLGRNHYNGDGPMMLHFCDVIHGDAAPETTVEQAFLAELMGYGSMIAGERNAHVNLKELAVPDMLGILENEGLYRRS